MRKLLVAVCLIYLSFASALPAQSNRATITGTVTDSSGAVVPGVTVSATNVATGIVTSSVSNNDGIYFLQNLIPGKYSVEFKKDGFKTISEPNIALQSTQVAELNANLEVGAMTQAVVVTAQAPVLDNETTTVGTNMKGDVVTDLPLSIYNGGRFVEDFAVAITPGYSPISSPYGAVVNGGQWFTKDYTIDGTTGSSSIPGDSMETGPSMEAVEELQAQTSGLDVKSAITGGGVMAFTLKSGTNGFHGSSFLYGHNELLDANTWTNDSLGIPKTKARAWDYGGSLGGPIRRNKTFFFGTFERYTQTDFRLAGFSSASTVPTSDFLQGNFSALLNTGMVLGTDTHGNTVYQGAIFNPSDPGAVFVGNQIPTTMFSSVAQKIIPIFQQDYAPEQPGLNGNNRLPLNNSPAQTPNEAVVKIDHNLSSNDRLSGSWIYDHRPRTLVDSGGIWQDGSTDGGPLSDARVQLVRSQQWRVSETHTFTPNLLNVFNATYNWYWNGSLPSATGTNWASQLGFGDTGADNFPLISFGNNINGHGVTFIGSTWQGNFVGATTVLGDSATWTKGRHAFTFGGEFRAYDINSHGGSGGLSFNFTPNTTDGGYTGEAGFGFASFLLGDVSTANETTPFNLYGRRKALSLYAQDSYKVTPKLTLTLGLRWEYGFRYHEKDGHWANYDLNAIDPTLNVPGTLTFLQNGSDSFEKKEYGTNFGPQIGFAYSPWNRWVFRGSFGLVYLPTSQPFFDGVPDAFAPGFRGTNSVNSAFNWDSGYPGVFVPGSQNVDPSTLFPLVYVDPHALMAGFSEAFNIGTEYEITPDMRVEVGYVGNRGHHLPDAALAWDEPSSSTFLNTLNANPGMNPYNDYIFCTTQGQPVTGQGVNGITCPFDNFYGPALATLAPNPQVANWSASYYYYYDLNYVGLPLGQSFYDSLIVDVVKRTGRGLTMDLSYTLSRQEGDSYSSQSEYNGYYTVVQDFGNLSQAAHTLTNYDQTHIVKGYAAYQLPFGNGQRWLASQNRFVNAVVGGWTLGGLVLYTSGQPFQAPVNNPYYPLWGNFYPDFNLSGFSGPADPHAYQAATASNPNPTPVFYMPQSIASSPIPSDPTTNPVKLGTGPAAISELRCPGFANEDASILKYFPMADGRYKLSFRAEFYNMFNRHTYTINGCGGVGNQIGASNFGQVVGVNDNPRSGQFAIRFTF
ncbi:MAG TPA: carboxypeptidase regulatory-like domain-containing protein [Candidatus Limnocylindrales bacterium]|nr:carboxypeptidase regulatory-like domain-containing protein [Candidatus Limnocylindrales bacterium]